MVSLDTAEVVAVSACTVFLLLVARVWFHYLHKQKRFKRVISGAFDEEGTANQDEKNYTISGNLVQEISDVPIISNYAFQDVLLGRGSSAHVVIGLHRKTQRRYAIKIIDTNAKNIAWKYIRELKMMKDTDHTNIVRVYEMYHKPSTLYFVMELCTGGHLGQVLKQAGGALDIKVAQQYILQLTRAIAHCHHLGIAHRDVKLQNILLESSNKDAQIKLVDFGNAARFTEASLPLRKIVGTTYTAAPEVFKQEYDERCDVWSMGVVTYILLSGHRPFESIDLPNDQRSRESSIIANILMGRYHFLHETWDTISDVAIHYVKCCLELDYTRRRTAEECLHHPWLAHNDLHEDLSANSMSVSAGRARKLSKALSRNMSSSGIRRTTMLGVAFMMPSNKVQTLRSLFQSMDIQGRGYINLEEFRSAMQLMNPGLAAADADLMFFAMDSALSGQISFTEFVAASLDPREVNIADLNRVFRLFDQDSKGYINEADLRRVLETEVKDDSGAVLSRVNSFDSGRQAVHQQQNNREKRQQDLREKIMSIIGQADLDKDGVISYTEFLFIMADNSASTNTTNNTGITAAARQQTVQMADQQPVVVHRATINSGSVPVTATRSLAGALKTKEAVDSSTNAAEEEGEKEWATPDTMEQGGVVRTDDGKGEKEWATPDTMEQGGVVRTDDGKVLNPEFEEKKRRRQSDSGVNVFGNTFSFRRSSMMFTALPSLPKDLAGVSAWFGKKAAEGAATDKQIDQTDTKGSFGAKYNLNERYDPNMRSVQGSTVNKNVINRFLRRHENSNDVLRQDISEEKSREEERRVPSIMQLIWMDLKTSTVSLYARVSGVPVSQSVGGIKGVLSKAIDSTEVKDESVSSSDSDEEEEDDDDKGQSIWSKKSTRRVSSPAMMWLSFKRRASVSLFSVKKSENENEGDGAAKVDGPPLGSPATENNVKHIVRDILQSHQPTDVKLARRGSSQRRASAIQFKQDNDGVPDMGGMNNDKDEHDALAMPRELRAELGLPEIDERVSAEQKAFEITRSTKSGKVKGHLKKSGSKELHITRENSKEGNSAKEGSIHSVHSIDSLSNDNSNGWGHVDRSMDLDGSSLSDSTVPLKELVAIIKKQQQMSAAAGAEASALTPEEAMAMANKLLENIKLPAVGPDGSPEQERTNSLESDSQNSSYLERMNAKNMKTIYEEGSTKPAGYAEAVHDAFQKGLQFGRSQATNMPLEVQRNEVDVEKASPAADRKSARRASFNG